MSFSQKMQAPEFKKYRNLVIGIKWSTLLPLTIAVLVAAWAIPYFAKGAVNPAVLWGIAVIILVFIIFFTVGLPLIRKGTYEGAVYNKKIVKTRVKEGQDTETYTQYHFAPILFIRAESGRKHQLEVSKEAYAYFSIGDAIKVHRGYSHPEKRDKDGDSLILCPRCGHTYPKEREQCPSCRMPNMV